MRSLTATDGRVRAPPDASSVGGSAETAFPMQPPWRWLLVLRQGGKQKTPGAVTSGMEFGAVFRACNPAFQAICDLRFERPGQRCVLRRVVFIE